MAKNKNKIALISNTCKVSGKLDFLHVVCEDVKMIVTLEDIFTLENRFHRYTHAYTYKACSCLTTHQMHSGIYPESKNLYPQKKFVDSCLYQPYL